MEYNHSIGAYTRWVKVDGKERLQVRRGKTWSFWTPADRAAPVIEWLQRKAEEKNNG